MSTSCSTNCKPDCTLISVITSLIIGIIAAFLRITAQIAVTDAFLWVLLGISVAYLGITLIAVSLSRQQACEKVCTVTSSVLIGILGTILFSVVLLAISFADTSVAGAVITGALLFFFFLTLTSTACLIRCFYNCCS